GKTDEQAAQPLSQPDSNDQSEQVWDHAEQAPLDQTAYGDGDDKKASTSVQPQCDVTAQLQELMSAWSRAPKEVRQQFLTSIGVSEMPNTGADAVIETEGASEPQPSSAAESLQSHEEEEPTVPNQWENPLMEEWNGLRGHSRAYGRNWVEAGCPD